VVTEFWRKVALPSCHTSWWWIDSMVLIPTVLCALFFYFTVNHISIQSCSFSSTPSYHTLHRSSDQKCLLLKMHYILKTIQFSVGANRKVVMENCPSLSLQSTTVYLFAWSESQLQGALWQHCWVGWQILGAIRTVTTAWEAAEIFFVR